MRIMIGWGRNVKVGVWFGGRLKGRIGRNGMMEGNGFGEVMVWVLKKMEGRIRRVKRVMELSIGEGGGGLWESGK